MTAEDHDARAWLAAFGEALPPALRPARLDALAPLVAAAWRAARAAHPSSGVGPHAFFTFLAQRLAGTDLADELARRHHDDLYLACGCARADASALAAFEAITVPAVERGLAGLRVDADARGELLQQLREQMLVAHDGPPGIAGYDGRAPLTIWLRVCAVRLGQRQAVRARRFVHADDRALEELAPGVPDPELGYMKRRYGAEFRVAFDGAVADLSARERNLLRHTVIDGLGIDQVAAIYHVHRATAARQLQRAREALAGSTRARLRQALQVDEHELDSILRAVMSVADITLRRVLGGARHA
jgi:RNA polymerase sigma-70 factor (ECF subfamily)